MMKDLLSSLIILNRQNYLHNDVKLDNIVLCEDRYKLIDWGAATPMDITNKTHGSLLTTSPLRWYCYGYTDIIARNVIPTKTYFYKPEISKSPLFQEQIERINAEFATLLTFESKRKILFETHKNTFDVFMLGMTLLHAVIERKLSFDTYRPIIASFTSLLEPLTARRALNLLLKE
jgi:serine/threonine protein kinase